MKQSTIKAKEALDRLFDRCEEIEPSEYRMLDDIFLIQDYLNKKHEANWELVYHDDQPAYYAHYVTARCSKCKKWFYGNENHHGDGINKYGAKLWAAFCMNYGKNNRSAFRYTALTSAEEDLRKANDLPTFCCHCGARMRRIEAKWWEKEN